MPFNRLSSNLAGQRAVGGDGRRAELTGGGVTAGVDLPEVVDNGDGSVSILGGTGSATKTTGTGPDLVIVYQTKLDGRVRPSHAALEGRQWEIDDPAAPAPPLGYGCRCRVEILDRAEAAKKAPKTEAAALKRFPNLSDNVDAYMGKEIGALYRAGKLQPADLLRNTGDPIGLTEARVIAAARERGVAPTKALQALAELNGMGLDDQAVRAFASQAQGLIDKGATANEALTTVLGRATRIGSLASRDPKVRAARIRAATTRFQRTGLLRFDPPELPKPVPKPPAPPAPVPAAVPRASQPAQVELEGRPFTAPTGPAYATGPLPDAPAYVQAAERQIARRTTERILVWDAAGKLVGDAEGKAAEVAVPRGIPRNATITHNHPSAQKYSENSPKAWGTSLSSADIEVAAGFDAARIRAVSPSGMVFEMARPAGGWPTPAKLRSEHARVSLNVQRELLASVRRGEIPSELADAAHYHLVNNTLARAIGATYSWGRYA